MNFIRSNFIRISSLFHQCFFLIFVFLFHVLKIFAQMFQVLMVILRNVIWKHVCSKPDASVSCQIVMAMEIVKAAVQHKIT